jgi:hypothetical protein
MKLLVMKFPCPRLLVNFRNKLIFYAEELLAPRPTSQAGGPPLVGCPRLLIQYIRKLLSISGGRLLHPQPEDAPCRGDKGSITSILISIPSISYSGGMGF